MNKCFFFIFFSQSFYLMSYSKQELSNEFCIFCFSQKVKNVGIAAINSLGESFFEFFEGVHKYLVQSGEKSLEKVNQIASGVKCFKHSSFLEKIKNSARSKSSLILLDECEKNPCGFVSGACLSMIFFSFCVHLYYKKKNNSYIKLINKVDRLMKKICNNNSIITNFFLENKSIFKIYYELQIVSEKDLNSYSCFSDMFKQLELIIYEDKNYATEYTDIKKIIEKNNKSLFKKKIDLFQVVSEILLLYYDNQKQFCS